MGRMTLDERRYSYANSLMRDGWSYKLTDYATFQYDLLKNIVTLHKKANWEKRTINDIIVMCDTETSKNQPTRYTRLKDGTKKAITQPNHIVCWTITLRACGVNIVTLRGRKPSEFAECVSLIHDALPGDITYFFVHNLPYDWQFLERHLFAKLGFPEKQLNVKPHYPIQIEFGGGIILRDSLILLQRSLEKAAEDLNVTHQKCVGSWDYDKIRHQNTPLTSNEWMYAEFDTLSGAECIDAYCKGLEKDLATLPLTATGIPRGDVRNIAKAYRWRDKFENMALTYEQYVEMQNVYHGGYTHGNRHFVDTLINENVRCYDFASSYPYTMCAYKFPMGPFAAIDGLTVERVLRNIDKYAFYFKFTMIKPQLKSDSMPMPFLQFSKCTGTVNAVCDNGRIINAEYAEIWLTEYDLAIICEQYKFKQVFITHGHMAIKDYLPKWFTDYIYELFRRKTMLKNGDPVLYALAKAKLNSVYGMTVQHTIRDNWVEDYQANTFEPEPVEDPKQQYENEIKKTSQFLPYQWGVWVTAIATYNLFQLGKCAGTWYYSDTDSCYASNWDVKAIGQYNDACKARLNANGYGPVHHNGRDYWLGVAESKDGEDEYTEYKYMGAKRYAGRNKQDGEIHITVAGVPKKAGAKCLRNSLKRFEPGFIFKGSITGKKTHTYITEECYIDSNGNECGNSVDLTECDYKLDSTTVYEWEDILYDEINIAVFEE